MLLLKNIYFSKDSYIISAKRILLFLISNSTGYFLEIRFVFIDHFNTYCFVVKKEKIL